MHCLLCRIQHGPVAPFGGPISSRNDSGGLHDMQAVHFTHNPT